MRRILLLSLLLVACDPCDEQERKIEVAFGDAFDELELEFARDAGWECQREGSLRDGFGRTIGTRYRCTKCG